MADFELLSTYITIRTRGLRDVIRDFGRARQAAQSLARSGVNPRLVQQTSEFARQMGNARLAMERIRASGRPVVQQVQSLARVQQRLHVLTQNTTLSVDQLRRAWALINNITARQVALQSRANNQLNQAVRAFGAVIQAARQAQRAHQQSMNAAARAFGAVIQGARQAQRANQQAAATAAAAWVSTFRQVAAAQQAMRQAMNSISLEAGFLAPFTRTAGNIFRIAGGFRQLAQSAGATGLALRLAGVAGVAFGVILKGIQIALNLAAAALRVIARVALSALRGAFQTLFGPTLAFLRLVRQLIQNLPILATAIGALLTRSLIRTAAEFQRISSGFEFAFGNNAQAELSRIIALANRLGVPLESITENYVRISSAARDAGLAQEDVRRLMEGVGSAAIALGLDVERVNGLFFAFEQIISKGRLSSEELRRQIGDRLPGAFAIAARAMGVTTAELDQLLEQGAIQSVDFIKAIGAELNRTFGGAAVRQANRLTATLNRLNNQWKLMRIELATRLEPAFVRIIEKVTDLITSVRNSAAFRAFTRFISSQLLVLEANFDRIIGNVRGILNQLAPTFQRLGRLILVLNTISIGGIVEAVRRLQPALDAIIVRIENFVTGLTGISFEGLGLNLQSVIAIAEALPLIFDAIALRIRLAFERFRQFLEFVTSGFSEASSLLVRTIGSAIQETLGILSSAYAKVQSDTALANEISAELLGKWIEIGLTIQQSLETTAVKRFELAVLSLAKRFVPLRTGALSVFETVFGGIDRINQAVRESLGLPATAAFAGGDGKETGEIVDITELRNVLERSAEERQQQAIASATKGTEANTKTIADHVAALDQKLSELPSIVETLVRSSVLALPGGGLGR
jgi:tape measure domain-containing protein